MSKARPAAHTRTYKSSYSLRPNRIVLAFCSKRAKNHTNAKEYRNSSTSKFIPIESKTNSDALAHGNAAGIFDCLTFLEELLIVFNKLPIAGGKVGRLRTELGDSGIIIDYIDEFNLSNCSRCFRYESLTDLLTILLTTAYVLRCTSNCQ